MIFQQFAKTLQKLEETPSRLAMTRELAQLFKRFDDNEIPPAIYMMQGKLVPAYESMEFNLSVKMVLRVLARLNSKEVTKIYKELGDLGLVAEKITKIQSPISKQLELLKVFEFLKEIAKDGGEGSQERKVKKLVDLLEQLDSVSAKYVVRIVIGKLRLGFSTMTILDALSWSTSGDKSQSKQLEQTYSRRADLGFLAQEYLSLRKENNKEERKKILKNIKSEVGVPIVPALCQRLNSAEEIIEKMSEVIAEPKYDGMRVQLHFSNTANFKQIKAYTRNLEEIAHMFPELEKLRKNLDCESCILDAEVVGINKNTGEIVSFQETIQRKRKHSVKEKASELPARFYIFDLLDLNGKSLVDESLRNRKELLKRLFINNEYLVYTPYILTTDASKLRKFHEDELAKGLEGAVIKQADSKYVAGRKGWNWVKIKEKQGQSGKLSDTLDLVIMGYYYGRGKRSSFGMGAFLVGVIKDHKILTIAKIGTGISDEQLKQIKSELERIKTNTKPSAYKVHKNLIPDVWVEPRIVVEIAADEITKSPVHSAGVALRFPRLMRIRSDKNWNDVTTTKELNSIQISK
ncbi:MAG: ATP-dependent DNA ligase [Patescibacteria group bacterium]